MAQPTLDTLAWYTANAAGAAELERLSEQDTETDDAGR
jgi:hypothetical protein